MSASSQPPSLWLNSDPSQNQGAEDLGGEIRFVGGALSRPEDGPWGDVNGAFGLIDGSPGGVRIANSKQTDIGCSEEGSLALLFRTPSDFSSSSGPIDQQLQVLFNRGSYASEQPFEIALVQGRPRLSYLQDGQSKTALMGTTPLAQNSWYWLALTWQRQDSMTSVTWRLWGRAEGLDQGSLETGALGLASTPVELAGRANSNNLKDGALSQVIVWNSAVSDEAWSRIESLLEVK